MRAAVSTPAPKVAVFLHSGDYDRVHQGLSIAAAAVASGRRVEVYLFWWALERFLQGRLDEPDFHPPREDVADRFETRRIPTLRHLLEHVRESGLGTVQGCTGSLGALGAEPLADSLAGKGPIDGWVGWSAILQRTAGVVDRFYL
jgi:peroxiredoxin family protein